MKERQFDALMFVILFVGYAISGNSILYPPIALFAFFSVVGLVRDILRIEV